MKKTSCLLSLLCVSLLFVCIQTQNTTSNVTYAPPPAINSTNLFKLNFSAADNKFIGSDRIENLDLIPVTVNSTNYTNFRINFFNRSQTTNLQNFTIFNTTGTWSYLISSKSSLSCSFVF